MRGTGADASRAEQSLQKPAKQRSQEFGLWLPWGELTVEKCLTGQMLEVGNFNEANSTLGWIESRSHFGGFVKHTAAAAHAAAAHAILLAHSTCADYSAKVLLVYLQLVHCFFSSYSWIGCD